MAEKLDEKAGDNPSKQIRIIRLKNASSTRVESALESIMRGGSYRGSYRGGYRGR